MIEKVDSGRLNNTLSTSITFHATRRDESAQPVMNSW